MRIPSVSRVCQSLLYIAAGVNHFWHEDFYVRIMPHHYTHLDALVRLSGAAEIAGGIGLMIPKTRRAAAAGIVLMLAVYFDVHIDMLRHAERYAGIPKWVLWGRIVMQFALMAWAWRDGRGDEGPQARLER